MTDKEQGVTNRYRIYFLDNLRTFMIFLVVLYHAGIVYGSGYRDFALTYWLVADRSTNDIADLMNL